MKLTRDPITLQPMIKIVDMNIVLKKDTKLSDIKEKPATEIIE